MFIIFDVLYLLLLYYFRYIDFFVLLHLSHSFCYLTAVAILAACSIDLYLTQGHLFIIVFCLFFCLYFQLFMSFFYHPFFSSTCSLLSLYPYVLFLVDKLALCA